MLPTHRVKFYPAKLEAAVSELPEAILYNHLHLASDWEVGKWHIVKMFLRECDKRLLRRQRSPFGVNIYSVWHQSSSAKQEQGTAQTVFVKDCDMLICKKTGLLVHSYTVICWCIEKSTALFQVFWRYCACVKHHCAEFTANWKIFIRRMIYLTIFLKCFSRISSPSKIK